MPSIRQISKNRAEQVGYYRFLENENVTVGELVRSLSDHCVSQVEGKHILAITGHNIRSHIPHFKMYYLDFQELFLIMLRLLSINIEIHW